MQTLPGCYASHRDADDLIRFHIGECGNYYPAIIPNLSFKTILTGLGCVKQPRVRGSSGSLSKPLKTQLMRFRNVTTWGNK